MATIDVLKEQATPPTPLFLFDCLLSSGTTERWSTHQVSFDGNSYAARLLKHNAFALQAAADTTITLANADSYFSQIERETGFRGSQLTITFLFYDLTANVAASESRVIFQGTGNTPDQIIESALQVTFTNRLNLSRIILPEVKIQRHCSWMFPATAAQRAEALTGGANGVYSNLYRCGYSPDQTGGVGNLDSGDAYTSCDYTRARLRGSRHVLDRWVSECDGAVRRNGIRTAADPGADLRRAWNAFVARGRQSGAVQRLRSAGVRDGAGASPRSCSRAMTGT